MNYSLLIRNAHEAGAAAAEAFVPRAMRVSDGAGYEEIVSEGPCGFAWIDINPAKGPFVAYLKKNDIGSKGYPKGWNIWVSAYGQSMQRKEAYARAFASVLRDAGIDARAGSRMD